MKYFLLVVLLALIVTSVWDGKAEAARIKLTWDAPTINSVDGICPSINTGAITDFSGKYEVQCGVVSGTWTVTQAITDTSTTVISNITVPLNGTDYYCVVTAINNLGSRSCPSNIVMKRSSIPSTGSPVNPR